MGERPGRRELAAAAQRAAARQPDEIRLISAPGHVWNDAAAVEAYAARLHALGFVDAGTYRVDVLPVAIRFLLNSPDRIYAAVYEHAKAGVWANLVVPYEDGRSATFTTTKDRGLEQRPGHPIVHAPGATADRLCALAAAHCESLARRKPLSPASIVTEFEAAWRDGVRWRKQRGFSMAEVASVIVSREGAARRVLRSGRIHFLAAQEGAPESRLKASLADLFGEHPSVEKAYLVRVRYDEASAEEVALCVLSTSPSDDALVEGIRKTFSVQFRAGNRLDVLFVGGAQAQRLGEVCAPFYSRQAVLH